MATVETIEQTLDVKLAPRWTEKVNGVKYHHPLILIKKNDEHGELILRLALADIKPLIETLEIIKQIALTGL